MQGFRKKKDKKKRKKKWDLDDDEEDKGGTSKSFKKLKEDMRAQEDRIRRNENEERRQNKRKGKTKVDSPREKKKKRPLVFFDIGIHREILGAGVQPIGRLEIELYDDVAPKTADNFRCLCTGEMGKGRKGFPLDYTGSIFHRIIPGFMAQGGDITHQDGSGGESCYGQRFDDENFKRKHDCAGILSMANAGKDTNGSQFFLLFKKAPHLDGKHVVFGKLVKGKGVLRKIESFGTEAGDPKARVEVMNSGEVGKGRDRGCLLVAKKRDTKVHMRSNKSRGFKHSSMGSMSRPIYM